MLFASCFLLVLFCSMSHVDGRDKKSDYQLKLCGEDFYGMHAYCCKKGCRNGKRQVEFTEGYPESDEKAPDVILKQKAMSFLKNRKHRYGKDFQRSKRYFAADNAYEECCVEGCSIEEVREYPCY